MIGIIFAVSIIIILLIFINKDVVNKDNIKKDDFEIMKKEFVDGNYTIIYDMPEEYYKRPEFYPWYDNYKNLNQTGKGKYGYGAYPGKVSGSVERFDKGKNIELYALVHSSYDVITFQGINLVLNSPNNELFDTSAYPSDILLIPVLYNITDEKEYRNLSWTYKIKMTIIAKIDIPKGVYTFKLRAGSVSPENNSKFYNITKKIGKDSEYVGSSFIQLENFFDFILTIKE